MRFQAQLNVCHLNIRREKAGKEPGALAADLKVSGKCHLEQVKDLFLTDHGYALLTGIFDGEGNLRTQDFKQLPLEREVTGARLKLTTALGAPPVEVALCNFDSFVLVPEIGNTVAFNGRLQFNTDEDQAGQLAGLLMKDVNVVLEQVQPELPLEKAGDDEGEQGGATP